MNPMPRASTSMFPAALLLCLIAPLLISGTCGSDIQPRRVVLISIDGLAVTPGLETHLAANHPSVSAFQRLIDEGASTLNARADPDKTRTLPGHFSLLTGRWVYKFSGGPGFCHPNEHMWFFNSNDDFPDSGLQELNEPCNRRVESIISMASYAGMGTRMVATKGPCQEGVSGKFCHILNSWCPTRIAGDPDCHFGDWLITDSDYASMQLESLTGWKRLNFFHHGLVDAVGHDKGVSTLEYRDALEQVSDWLHLVLNRVPKNTVVIVTSDHGHGGGPGVGGGGGAAVCVTPNGKSHTCNTHIQNTRIPMFIWDRDGNWPAGGDLYDLLPLCDPGDVWVSQDEACQPIRIQHVAQLVSDELGIDPPPGAIGID